MRLGTFAISGSVLVASSSTSYLAAQKAPDPNLPWMLKHRDRLDLLAHMMRDEEKRAAYRELARRQAIVLRRQQIQDQVAELLDSTQLLKRSLDDPNIVHVDSFRLAKRCEKLATHLRKLLKKPL